MGIATFEVATSEATFQPGTVAGNWHWVLRIEGTGDVIKDWATTDTYASADVEAEVSYKISVQRMDADKAPLGPVTSAGFTTESVPQEVIVDVSASIAIAIDGIPVGAK